MRQVPLALSQAPPGKEDLSYSRQVTELAWLNSTSYPGIWIMVAQVPIRGKRREWKQLWASIHYKEVAGLENIWSSCVTQVEERDWVEQPEREREQSAALGLRGGRSFEVMSRERDWGFKRPDIKLL